jgi:hypothetical protein
MADLKCSPTQIQSRACFRQLVVMAFGKGEALEKEMLSNCDFSLLAGQDSVRSKHIPADGIVRVPAQAISLRESLIRRLELLLMGQSNGFNRPLADDSFRIVRSGVNGAKEVQSFSIHTSEKHGFRFQKLISRGPGGIGNLELSGALLGFLLASCQVPLLKELPGMVIRSLGAAGACVFERN